MVELVRTGRTAEELSREFECSAQAIRNWVCQADLDEGRRSDGLTTAQRDELRRGTSPRTRRDGELSARIAAIHRDSRGTYGVPHIHAELAEDGERVARKRVARLMRAHGLRGVSRRKWTRTTLRDAAETPVPALVERDFTASRPNALWVADAT